MKKIMSIDAETNGLQGRAFAIGAVLRYEDGTIEEFVSRCPIDEPVDVWVAENVLPEMKTIPVNSDGYEEMLQEFANFYLKNKENCMILVHCGLPVEARLFIEMYRLGHIGQWDMPLPLFDVSSMLHMIGETPDEIDSFNKKNGIVVPSVDGSTHNPLYDSYAALMAYDEIVGRVKTYED